MHIRRRPSAATLVAVLVTLALGSQVGLAAQSSQKARGAPQAVRSVEVTAADSSSVTIAWPPSRDNDAVAGYGIYVDGAQVGTETPENVRKGRDRDSLSYTIRELACGKGYTVGVDAFDRDDNHSPITSTTVSTSACPDATPPSAPTGVRQVATTESSVMLAWSPSADNVGVVEYGLYVGSLRVATSSEASATLTNLACGTAHLVGLDAADAAGNRSARVDSYFRTAACPSTNQPPSTPTGLKVTAATATSVSLAWTASTDDGAVAGYGMYVAGQRTNQTTTTNSATYTGLQCGTTYALGVDAYDNTGKRSTVAELSSATSPCAPPPPSLAGTVTQTIVNGATIPGIVNWRAVYDSNGDGIEDDPGKIEFRVDGNLLLSEELIPFGDTFADGSTTVGTGSHTFQVRALSDSGTLLATNTVTATINTETPPPPPADTTAPSQPTNQRVVSATATSVTIAWNASTDNVGVTGYDIYRATTKVGSTTTTTYTINGLTCGTAYSVGIRALDQAGNTSSQATMSATTSACADSQPPTAPTNVTASTRTTTSIALTWAAATDNVGVAAYGIYNAGELVNTTTGTTGIVSGLTCGTNYTLAVDAFDASGNSSAKTTIMVSTLPCPDTTPPTVTMISPTSGSTLTGTINASANAADNVGVTRVDFFRDGVSSGSDTSSPFAVPVDTTTIANGSHTFGARAFDAAGNVGNATNVTVTVSSTTPPPSLAGTVTQTIVNGATIPGIVNWRAVYDSNGDGIEDDPGKIEFRVDGNLLLSEELIPFGDTFADGSTTVGTGSHTFQVRALSDNGTLLATNTVTATVANQSPPPPPPPPPSTGYPDASNTGVPAGTVLTAYTGSSTISTANTVINGKTIGCIDIRTTGVVIRNSRISCGGSDYYAVDSREGNSVLIEDSEIDCQSRNANGAAWANITLRRVEITGCENGLHVDHDVTVEDSYIHDLYNGGGAHMDGMQFGEAADDVTIRHNTIYAVSPSGALGTSALIMDLPGHSNFLIENNLFGGGAFTVYCVVGTGVNWRIINNRFTLQYGREGTSGAYGFSRECSDDTQSGNVIHETGLPLNLG